MTVNDYVEHANTTGEMIYVSHYFGDTLNALPMDLWFDLDVISYDVKSIERDGYDTFLLVGKEEYFDLLERVNNHEKEKQS